MKIIKNYVGFRISFRATLLFSLVNALVDNSNRPGHSLGKKLKYHEMKNEITTWVFVFQKYSKF